MKKKILLYIGVLCILFCFIVGCGKLKNSEGSSKINTSSSDITQAEKGQGLEKEKNTSTSISNNDASKVENNNNNIINNAKDEIKDENALKVEEKKDSLKDVKSKKISSEENQKNSVDSEKSKNENKSNKETFTIVISKEKKGYTGKEGKILKTKEVEVSKDKKSAMTYLRENFSMKENGGLIYEIDNIHNIYPIPQSEKNKDQKKNGVLGVDWFIYLNDVKTPVGANDIYPKKGDVLNFDIHEWDKREFKQ